MAAAEFKPIIPGSTFIRIALLSAAVVILTYLVLAQATAHVMRSTRGAAEVPGFVFDATAKANRAAVILALATQDGGKPDPNTLSRVENMAQSALGRDLLVPAAWRTLAAADEAKGSSEDNVLPYYEASSQISRRDLPTQAWLLRYYLKRGDTAKGFRQLDLAMRRSSAGRELALPLLARSVGDSTLHTFLANAFAADVPWRSEFFLQLTRTPPSEEDFLKYWPTVSDQTIKEEKEVMLTVAAGLVQQGLYRAAREIILRTAPTDEMLANGNFEQPNNAPPFDWEMQSTNSYEAVQGAYADEVEGENGAFIRLEAGTEAQVMRQILFLYPGQYSLEALSGPDRDGVLESLSLRVNCGATKGAMGRPVGEMQLALGRTPRRTKSAFTVPDECPAQWLTVFARGAQGAGDQGAWIDSVKIVRTSGGGERINAAETN
ncbi:hypothetical protein [Allopontixanthobacter sediminis]|uniref:Uncharacterized protein n=1 Tax=Allopontixanthobacter sediminis TaxID=1689985 RepID=A0A845AZE8_9SPHN|nr:hypothetical protein [Allopontixanthobacter sediminis]MXP44401.1 hypothetical protein [Allopontixanthobacter sediminis]